MSLVRSFRSSRVNTNGRNGHDNARGREFTGIELLHKGMLFRSLLLASSLGLASAGACQDQSADCGNW